MISPSPQHPESKSLDIYVKQVYNYHYHEIVEHLSDKYEFFLYGIPTRVVMNKLINTYRGSLSIVYINIFLKLIQLHQAIKRQ